MVVITQQIEHKSGIPLGGMGTGSVEIRPDGLFYDWEIFNVGAWNPKAPGAANARPEMNPDDLVFILRTRTHDGSIIMRYLAVNQDLHDLYHISGIRSVEEIRFEGAFPAAKLTYVDHSLPVQVQAEMFSPFVPLDSRASGTPGFYISFQVKNLTSAPVEVSILGVMRNAAGYDQGSRRPRNVLEPVGTARAVVLSADGLEQDVCSAGDMTFAADGGDVTFATGCYRSDWRVRHFRQESKFKLKSYTLLHDFEETGALPLSAVQTAPEKPDFNPHDLDEHDLRVYISSLMQHPVFYDKYQQIRKIDPELADSAEFAQDCINNIDAMTDEWGWTALCSRSVIPAEAESEALFCVSWYFPNHISPSGANIGHKYSEWFGGSLDVTRFLLDNYTDLREKSFALPDAVINSSMPPEATDAVLSQLSTLTKCTWWTRDGNFGVWEGLGCCGFHTTDITYQGSFPIISLFPDLQKRQMEHGAQFQRDDGRVHHFFTPDLGAVDNGFDRVDMNQQFVMLAARDYLWTGDRSYLERLWPHILKAMDNTALLDSDGDGLPDTDTKRNTYDIWDFVGCPSYISSLWLGALKAAVRLAKEMDDKDRAKTWQAAYNKALKSFEKKLWNGEYYVLWRNGDEVDECCMSDQMSGDWFSSACGWGNILPPQRIRQALNAIMRYNFAQNRGLINASYPPGKPRKLGASDNFQTNATWTGIEYTVASLLIDYGMVGEGLAIVRDIHDRYLRAGRFWNHIECGGHYYRAMSSWSVMLALSGIRWDAPTASLTFAPAIEQPVSEYPFFTSSAWGVIYADNGLSGRRLEISVIDGETEIKTLNLPKLNWFRNAKVYVGDKQAACKIEELDNGMRVTFSRAVTIDTETAVLVLSSQF